MKRQPVKTGADETEAEDRAPHREFVYQNGLCFEKTPHGLIFRPEYRAQPRKHDCPDCMQCALCSDPRCALCRGD